jgi:hypothetical protein
VERSKTGELSMQRMLLSYLETHLKQLKVYFPGSSNSVPIPDYKDDERYMQTAIMDYLNGNGVH